MLPAEHWDIFAWAGERPGQQAQRLAHASVCGHAGRVKDDLQQQLELFEFCVLHRDVTAAEAVLDASYALALVAPAYARMPRARWLEVLPEYAVRSYVVEELQLDVDGDTAAVPAAGADDSDGVGTGSQRDLRDERHLAPPPARLAAVEKALHAAGGRHHARSGFTPVNCLRRPAAIGCRPVCLGCDGRPSPARRR